EYCAWIARSSRAMTELLLRIVSSLPLQAYNVPDSAHPCVVLYHFHACHLVYDKVEIRHLL
ncbi:MAG: hypothetical protein V3V61_05215, partial [Gammaproteobacteria bacterium]